MLKKLLHSKNYYKFILFLGFLLGLLWICFVNTQPFSDFDYYNNLAKQIANGGPWGDTYTSVGYAIVLGLIYKIFGAHIFIAKVFNLLLTLVCNIFVFKILSKTNLREGDKKFILTLFILFPNNIFFNSILGTEILFTTLMMCTIYIYFSNIRYKYVLLGILVGLNTMIKPFFLLFFFLVFMVEVIYYKKLFNPLKHGITILIIASLTLSPWIYRNTKLMGQFTYVSNNGGIVLYINNNSQNKLGRWMPVADVENSIINRDDFKKANMTQQNKMFSKAAKKWILTHPLNFVELGFKRLANTYLLGDDVTYSLYGTGASFNVQRILFLITNLIRNIIFIPAIIFMIIQSAKIIKNMFKKNAKAPSIFNIFLLILFYMFTCVYFITEGQGRYAFPTIIIMIYYFYFAFYPAANKSSFEEITIDYNKL